MKDMTVEINISQSRLGSKIFGFALLLRRDASNVTESEGCIARRCLLELFDSTFSAVAFMVALTLLTISFPCSLAFTALICF